MEIRLAEACPGCKQVWVTGDMPVFTVVWAEEAGNTWGYVLILVHRDCVERMNG